MTIKNFSLTQKAGAVLTSFALVTTLVGCGNTKSTSEEPEVDTAIGASTEKPQIDSEVLASQEEASSAVESAVTIMIESTEALAESSEEAKQTESYQAAKETTKQNFDDLFGFLFQDEEIAGYTISEVGRNTVSFCKDGLVTLDAYIESYIPEYKDKAKEKLKSAGVWVEDKLTDLGAWGINKSSELKEKTLQKYYDKYGNN